jgi:RimJ/RimL family protein N-acetyltransferase
MALVAAGPGEHLRPRVVRAASIGAQRLRIGAGLIDRRRHVAWRKSSHELRAGLPRVGERRKNRLKILFVGADDERVLALAANLRRDHRLILNTASARLLSWPVPSRRTSHKPPRIVLDDLFVLDGPRMEDAAAHRRFALDPDAARFFGWTVGQARSAPDSHYVEGMREFIRGWETGARLSLAIRRISDGQAVGTVELWPSSSGDEANLSYFVVPELRGQGLASRAVARAKRERRGARGSRTSGSRSSLLDQEGEAVSRRSWTTRCSSRSPSDGSIVRSRPRSLPTAAVSAQKRACQRSATRANRCGSRSRTSKQSASASASVSDFRSAAAAQAAGRCRARSRGGRSRAGAPGSSPNVCSRIRVMAASGYPPPADWPPLAARGPNSRAAQSGQKNTTSSSPSSSRSTRYPRQPVAHPAE